MLTLLDRLQGQPRPVLLPQLEARVLTRIRVIRDQHPTNPVQDDDGWLTTVDSVERAWTREGVIIAGAILATQTWNQWVDTVFGMYPDDPEEAEGPVGDAEYKLEEDSEFRAMWAKRVEHEVRFLSRSARVFTVWRTHADAVGANWEDIERSMEAEADVYEAWAEGDCWGFVIETHKVGEVADGYDPEDYDPDDPETRAWVEGDSCWGFYGTAEDNGMMDHVPDELHDELRRALAEPEYD